MKNNILDSNSIKGQECTGCSMCSAVCPTNAINIELTKYGFYEPVVNNELCIECGCCKKTCYKFDGKIETDKRNDYKSYSAINKNEGELKTSTSGGVSIELMRACIDEGYKILGVAYDYEKDIAVTKIVSNKNELQQFKGSKYFQSYTADALDSMIKDKTNQKYAIFGTPCQIYSIAKYAEIKNNREKFILVDLFCHGCPSINLWKKYLKYSKEKNNVEKFDSIEFRSKVHGWHEFGFKFRQGNNEYNNKKINDPFYELFFDMNTHNQACYKCKMRSSIKYTDIRMGDFWGPQYDTDIKGVSAIIIGTERGSVLFNKIGNKVKVNNHEFEKTVKAQSYGKAHKYDDKLRRDTLEALSSQQSFEETIKKYKRKYSMKKKLKKNIKNNFKRLPINVYFKIKKMLHSI